jgi:putative FmdB family regulatory protein
MPIYNYKCERGHEIEIEHSISTLDHPRYCVKCTTKMHRVPQPPRVNWNGLPPHEADARPPVIQNFIDDATERRAKYLDTKDKKHAK